jgi:AraC family transcriptional activator of pobA
VSELIQLLLDTYYGIDIFLIIYLVVNFHMPLSKDMELINEFRHLIKRHTKGVINLDETFTQKFEFIILRCEDILQNIGTVIPANKWSYNRVAFLTNGSADYVSGIYKFRMEKNTMMFLPARAATTSVWAADSTGYFILFNQDFLLHNHISPRYLENKRILHNYEQPYIHLNTEQALEADHIFETIYNEYISDNQNRYEFIAIKLAELLLLAERFLGGIKNQENGHTSNDLVNKFAELVEQHFTRERSVNFYASQLNVHPNHLNAVIKSNVGVTAKECILNRILLETKYLLHNTQLSVKEISNQLGFDDPNYFTAFFKRSERLSPQTYRSTFV